MFNRKRFNVIKYINLKNTIILVSIICVVVASVTCISAVALKRKVAKSTVVYKEDNEDTEEILNVASNIDNKENIEDKNNTDKVENDNLKDLENLNENTQVIKKDEAFISLNLLGEIMMGGEVNNNVEYIYSTAFKDIYTIARASDFTYATLPTNITNLEKIEDPKSKYIVTKEVINGLNALGIDAVSIASDHITDFSNTMIRTTKGALENANIYVAGLKDNPLYFEKNNKKIAIISTNSVIIGTKENYTNNNISVYDSNNLKKNIEEAKKSADIVIVDVHWGRDYEYGVTAQMSEIAHFAIDNGADMVIGSHALGVYPIIKYKDKPIIYSLGYLISDTDYYVGKESFIFNVSINKDAKITKLTMIPTYIKDKKQTLLYKNYDKDKMNEYLKQMNNWNVENSLDSKIVNDTIEINF